ncbi:MAG: YceI family protein [Halofilum sp. (in: g-proteobacteria)]
MRRASSRIAAALLVGGVSLASWGAPASQWQVVHDESTLAFTATQTGSEFDGAFEFAADMRFDRADLAASAFDVTVDITSVDTGSRRRDQALADQAWFWFEQHPEAYFRSKRIEHIAGDRYEAVADLTIKENTHEVTLPFTWEQDGDSAELQGTVTARMQGGLTMDRTRWDVGTGEWSSGDTIGREVEVRVDLRLTR